MGAPLEITRRDYTAVELRSLSGRCSDGAQVRRILTLAMVLEGRSRTEAAELGGMERQTLRDWVHRYNRYGLEGCCQPKRFGSGFAPPLPRFLGSSHQSSKKTREKTPPPSLPSMGPTN